jgi:hypothetical protein
MFILTERCLFLCHVESGAESGTVVFKENYTTLMKQYTSVGYTTTGNNDVQTEVETWRMQRLLH